MSPTKAKPEPNCKLVLLLGLSLNGRHGNSFLFQRSKPNAVVAPLHSFSSLGDLGVDDYGSSSSSTRTKTTETMEPSILQKFPLPPPLQKLQQWNQPEPKQTTQFYEDVSTLPAPPIIKNPFDGSTKLAPPKINTKTKTNALTKWNTHTITEPMTNVKSIWETSATTIVQGGSLRTWNFMSEQMEAVQVLLKTNGRPLHCEIELWQGEDHTPQKIAVYTEDGESRPFSAFVATPYVGPTAIAVKNSANMEFPLQACVEGDLNDVFTSSKSPLKGKNSSNNNNNNHRGNGNRLAQNTLKRLWDSAKPRTVQGDGAQYVVPFDASVARVQILITSETRPLNARIELLQGPNNVKQVIEVSTEDGMARPFFCVVETPGTANVLRIVNTGPLEFPIDCRVEPFAVVEEFDDAYFFDTAGAGQEANTNMFMLN